LPSSGAGNAGTDALPTPGFFRVSAAAALDEPEARYNYLRYVSTLCCFHCQTVILLGDEPFSMI